MTSGRESRLRVILAWIGGVLLLTAVIVGVSMIPRGSRPGDDRGTSLEHNDLTSLATEALSSGDATQALSLAERALKRNADDTQARDVAAQARKRIAEDAAGASAGSHSGGSQSGGSSGGTKGGGQGGSGSIADPAALLPKSFTSYSLAQPISLEGEHTVSGTPSSSSPNVRSIVWTIQDARTSAEAAAFVQKTSKTLYSRNGDTVDVSGSKAYFGTDGTRYATCVFTYGQYVFEVLVSGVDADPASYRDTAVAAARAFGRP